jgi:MoaA/NifB/PqqE/SkfB family radical SAM enzyme
MEALRDGTPIAPLNRNQRDRINPFVIWHPCLSDPSISGHQLDTPEALALLDQLCTARVRALILSGCDPMARPDFYKIIARARELELRVLLSTDGSRLTCMNAVKLAAYRLEYVGIHIDGLQYTHNHVQRSRHAYQRALRGLRAARNAELRVGMHMALSPMNAAELPAVVALADSERIDRFHLSQPCPADCTHNAARDASLCDMTRASLDWLFDHVWKRTQNGNAGDFVTSQHAANGAYLLHWIAKHMPHRLPGMREYVARKDESDAAGMLFIDPIGAVHPGTTRLNVTYGNVRDQLFGEIAARRLIPA